MSPGFLRTLAYIAEKNGFNVDGMAAVMSHESRFNPRARAANSTATGLIQIIESTAHSLGTTTAALLEMTAVQQLIFVERFYQRYLNGVRPAMPENYLSVGYGRLDAVGKPDGYVLDRRDSEDPREAERYRVNAGLDRAGDGTITAGDLRASIRGVMAAARGDRVEVPPAGDNEGGGSVLVAAAVIGVVVAVGAWIARRAG